MPTPSTTFSYHVPGPITPYFSIGLDDAFVAVGVCADGADITFKIATKSVKSDGGGGEDGVEVEEMALNTAVEVRLNLVPYGGLWMDILRALAMGWNTPVPPGEENSFFVPMPGTLYGINDSLPGLYLPSNDPDGGWLFGTGRVIVPGDNKVNVTETNPLLIYRCFTYLNQDPNFLNPGAPVGSPFGYDQMTVFNAILFARV